MRFYLFCFFANILFTNFAGISLWAILFFSRSRSQQEIEQNLFEIFRAKFFNFFFLIARANIWKNKHKNIFGCCWCQMKLINFLHTKILLGNKGNNFSSSDSLLQCFLSNESNKAIRIDSIRIMMTLKMVMMVRASFKILHHLV